MNSFPCTFQIFYTGFESLVIVSKNPKKRFFSKHLKTAASDCIMVLHFIAWTEVLFYSIIQKKKQPVLE